MSDTERRPLSISREGRNARTLNWIKMVEFDHPDWTPCQFSLMPATWMKYRAELEAVVLAHPRVWPDFAAGTKDYDDPGTNPLYELGEHIDCWGVVWNNCERGLDSMAISGPLEDWAALDSYAPPNPMTQDWFGPRRPWAEAKAEIEAAKARGDLATGPGLPHGFMYMNLFYLHGFDNLMMDLGSGDPRVFKLIDMVEGYNQVVINKYIEMGAEHMSFAGDLGLQKSLPMSPRMWRKYIKPSYMHLYAPMRERGIPISQHTDGHILEIIPDLIEAGVTLLNPQIRANGLEGLQQVAMGRVALNQDLDRQLFPFASPAEVQDHIHEVFEGLYLPEGGLMLHAEAEPDVSLKVIDAIATTLEEVCDLPPAEVI